MKLEELKEGLFIKYVSEQIFAKKYIYGRVMSVDDEKVRILTYDDFDVLEFPIKQIKRYKDELDDVTVVQESELKHYLTIRKEVLTDLLQEVKENHIKEVLDINSDISKLETCINDLKS